MELGYFNTYDELKRRQQDYERIIYLLVKRLGGKTTLNLDTFLDTSFDVSISILRDDMYHTLSIETLE